MTQRFGHDTASDTAVAAAAWALRLADHEPDAATLAAWRQWLDSDPACRPAFARAVAAWGAFDTEAPWLDGMVCAARNDARRRRRLRGARGHIGWLAAACLVMALVVGGALWWIATAPTTYATGIGERRIVQLQDGSRISLDADSRVEVAYSRDHRRLHLLHGRIVCDVAKDPLRPFSVHAADKVVVATGTRFSVELVLNQVRVVLYRGHVAVLNAGGHAGRPQPVQLQGRNAAADLALQPGREMVVPVRRNAAVVTSINPTRSLSWERGQLDFHNEPLALAVDRVNRYAHAPLAVGDAVAAHTRISGVFTAGDTTAFISGVTTVFPIRIVERNGVRTFVSTAH